MQRFSLGRQRTPGLPGNGCPPAAVELVLSRVCPGPRRAGSDAHSVMVAVGLCTPQAVRSGRYLGHAVTDVPAGVREGAVLAGPLVAR